MAGGGVECDEMGVECADKNQIAVDRYAAIYFAATEGDVIGQHAFVAP